MIYNTWIRVWVLRSMSKTFGDGAEVQVSMLSTMKAQLCSLLTLAMCGCSRPSTLSHPVTQSEIVGTWVAKDGSNATIKFSADGSVIINAIPAAIFEGSNTRKKNISSRGTWELNRQPNSQDIDANIELHSVNNEPAMGSEMDVQNDNGVVKIFFPVGDPDDGSIFEFRKESSEDGFAQEKLPE